jgi:uncharacterized membrane protein YbhN (UPF0104 family)
MQLIRRFLTFLLVGVLVVFVVWFARPKDLLRTLQEVPARTFVVIILLFFLNLFVVAFRFWRVLAHFGLRVPWGAALRASMAGNLGGLFFIPLFGQVAGRHALLASLGVTAPVNASLSAYERVVLAVTSAGMALAGGLYLSGHEKVEDFIFKVNSIQVAAAALVGFSLSCILGAGSYERSLGGALFRKASVLRVAEVILTTLLAQSLVLSSFVISFRALLPSLDLTSLFAASAVVSFAASFPISAGGWGVREVAAVYVLGLLGASPGEALAASVVAGFCSTLALMGAIPFVWAGGVNSVSGFEVSPSSVGFSLEKSASWILPFCAVVAVFFQLHVPIGESPINVNLADPFALIVLTTVCLQSLQKRALPQWRLSDGNLILGLISLALLIGFAVGWREIGVTQWALSGRLLGWIVLLGYASVGHLLVSNHGTHGLRRAIETLLTVGFAVVAIKAVNPTSGNFEGFAANRNAFAFQLLTVSALAVGYSVVDARSSKVPRQILVKAIFQGVVFLGIVLSGSRTGMGALGLILLVGWFGRLADRRFIFFSVLTGACLWALADLLPKTIVFFGGDARSLQSSFSKTASDHARWAANKFALTEWNKQPVFGLGLGVFIQRSQPVFGFPLIIHCTPIWILAEFGIVGTSLAVGAFFRLFRYGARQWRGLPGNRALILLLLMFCSFSLLHEVFFQRIFWLALGLLLATRRNQGAGV